MTAIRPSQPGADHGLQAPPCRTVAGRGLSVGAAIGNVTGADCAATGGEGAGGATGTGCAFRTEPKRVRGTSLGPSVGVLASGGTDLQTFSFGGAGMGTTINNWLGRSEFGGDALLNGDFNQFAIYNTALTQDAVNVLVALIVDALAPTFDAQKNFPNALKLTVYSYTPGWLAGIFLLIPGLSFLTILGLYGLYLMWLGLPPLMQAPRDKALPYAAAVVVCAVIIAIVIGAIQAAIFLSR